MTESLNFQELLGRSLPETFYDFISVESCRHAETDLPQASELAEALACAIERALATSRDVRELWSALTRTTVQAAAQRIVSAFMNDHSVLNPYLSLWVFSLRTAFYNMRELPFYDEQELMQHFGSAGQDELIRRMQDGNILYRVVSGQIVAPVWQFEPDSLEVRGEVYDLSRRLEGRVSRSKIDDFLRSQFPSVVRGVSTEYDYMPLPLKREERVKDLIFAFEVWERPWEEDWSVPGVQG